MPAVGIKLAIAAILLALCSWLGYTVGSRLERVEWMERLDEVEDQIAEDALLRAETELHRRRAQDAATQRVGQQYESTIATLRDRYARAMAGGLRIPACGGGGAAAPGAGGPDAAASERLPAEVERRLFLLAGEADTCSTRLTALQQWIKEQGMYQQH